MTTMPNIAQDSIEKLYQKLEFFETSLSQIKKEFPHYLQKKHDMSKYTKSLSRVLTNAASTEKSINLQSALFMTGQKYQNIEKHYDIYTRCENECSDVLSNIKKYITVPYREILNDSVNNHKNDEVLEYANRDNDRVIHEFHAKMFEQHKIASIKQILIKLIRTEIYFHSKAIEELSSVLSTIDDI